MPKIVGQPETEESGHVTLTLTLTRRLPTAVFHMPDGRRCVNAEQVFKLLVEAPGSPLHETLVRDIWQAGEFGFEFDVTES